MEFRDFLALSESAVIHGGALVPSTFSVDDLASTAAGVRMPSIDMELPSVTKTSRIEILVKNKTPIYVQLTDGTKLAFTHDEFRRIKGEPMIGKMMTVTFQRPPDLNNNNLSPSLISACSVH